MQEEFKKERTNEALDWRSKCVLARRHVSPDQSPASLPMMIYEHVTSLPLAVGPEVLLFDERSSALDPIATSKIEELLFQLKESCTIVIVTHYMKQAARIADRTGVFLSGRLVEIQDTSIMFKNPTRKETEDYFRDRFG